MKNALGWLSDPYLHVILIGVGLFYLGAVPSTDEAVSHAANDPYCTRCLVHHEGTVPVPCIGATVADLVLGK